MVHFNAGDYWMPAFAGMTREARVPYPTALALTLSHHGHTPSMRS